jgi:RNA polymerase sigma-70 factor (ECF subfamily)
VRLPVEEVGAETIARVHREEWARVVAVLTRRFGDLDIAEEMAAEAFAIAVERWPTDGVPPNPGAWITTTANRRAIDRLRRESRRDDKQKQAQMLYDDTTPPLGAIEDDRLQLIFICCHPALAMEARIALTLRMVGGLTVPEIAHAFLVQEATIGQRITRAKAKIKAANIPYRVPSAEDLPGRTSGVLAVLFLIFNEGYLTSDPQKEAVRSDLTLEAIRLTRLLQALLPTDGEVAGLLALMLLTEARRPARISASGELVTLDEQDRGAWDAALIAEGHWSESGLPRSPQVRDTRPLPDPGGHQRSAYLRQRRSRQAGPGRLPRLPRDRADLLRRLGRSAAARAAYEKAIELAGNTAEIAYLARRRDQLGPN